MMPPSSNVGGKDFWFNPCSIMRGFLFVFFKLGLAEKAEG